MFTDLIERGWSVFPLQPGSKAPARGESWPAVSTSDAAVAWSWFSGSACNVGVDCGKSGLVVVDEDVEGEFARLCANHGGHIPPTHVVGTPNGRHYYFTAGSSALRNRAKPDGYGLDVRAAGGYVVGAGSVIDGRHYVALDRLVPATLPSWLERALSRPVSVQGSAPGSSGLPDALALHDGLWTLEQASTACHGKLVELDTAPKGTRNDTLNRVAMFWGHFGEEFWPGEAAQARLASHGRLAGLNEGEVAATVSSGYAAGRREPWTLDEDDADVDALLARIKTAKELAERPPLEWLVDGLLPRVGLGRIYGPSGSMKSFAAMELLARVGDGGEWAGRSVRKGRGLYVVAEGQGGVPKRIKAWELHHGAMPEFDAADWPLQVDGKSEWRALLAAAERVQWDLIVFDTQALVTAGQEENSATEMAVMVRRLGELSRASQGCVVLVHHTGHDPSRSRGSSSVYAAMDAELSVSREQGFVVVQVRKSKDDDGDYRHVYGTQVVVTEPAKTPFERSETSVVLTDAIGSDRLLDRRLATLTEMVIPVLREEGSAVLSAREIWARASARGMTGRDRLYAALAAVAGGEIDQDTVAHCPGPKKSGFRLVS